jgi:hypothetical protein
MGFTSALPPVLIAANKVAEKVAEFPHGASTKKRQLEPWDPTRCNYFEQEDISNAFRVLGTVYAEDIEDRGGDWVTLGNLLKTQTLNTVDITCECNGGPPMSSNLQRKSLNICLDTSNTRVLEIWLLVEGILLSGGTTLDAWAIKNYLFNIDKSDPVGWIYRALPAAEKDLMCAGGTPLPTAGSLAGKFTIWNVATGDLWPSTKNAQGQRTTYGTSLLWNAGLAHQLWEWPC